MDFDYWKSKALEENPSLRESKPVVTDPGKYDTEIPLPLSDEEVIVSEPVRTDETIPGPVTPEAADPVPGTDGAIPESVIAEVTEPVPSTDATIPATTNTDVTIPGTAGDVTVSSGASYGYTDAILNENVNEIKEPGKAGRVCKAIFLGIPFGIPIFIAMLALLTAAVAVMCLVFGILVMGCTALCAGGLALILLGIANVQNTLGAAFLLMGAGVLACGLGFLLILLTRVVFKYLLLGLFKCYVLPVKFVKMFFCKKKTQAGDIDDTQSYTFDPETRDVETQPYASDFETFDDNSQQAFAGNADNGMVEILADDEPTEEAEKPKRFIKTFSILAGVLTLLGAVMMITTYFVFYSDDIPSNLQQDHKVIVEGKVIGIDVTSSYFNVSIEKGDEFCVLLADTYKPGTEVTIEDGILKIKGDYCDSLDVFGFDVSPASKLLNPFAGDVTVIVPESEYMQLVYADIGCGSFKMKDVSCARLVAQVGAGSICLDNADVAFERFLECKLGTVYANGEMNLAINHADSSSDM